MEDILGFSTVQGHNSCPPLLRGLNPDCISSYLVMQQTQMLMFRSFEPGKQHVLVTLFVILECFFVSTPPKSGGICEKLPNTVNPLG